MSNKTRSALKVIAVLLVVLCIAMQLGWIIIPAISGYKFWIMVVAFGILLVAAK